MMSDDASHCSKGTGTGHLQDPPQSTKLAEAEFRRWLDDVPVIIGSSFAPKYCLPQTLET